MESAARPRLVAGTSAGERQPSLHPRPERDWHLPPHARVPDVVRERQARQVAAGADVLLAQTYLTHRRALARVGEARRARELTAAAVDVARSAIDVGLERRRSEDRPLPETVTVAGALPAIADVPESATGLLLPRASAIEQDLESHAGMLAESGVELIVVEPGTSPAHAVAGAAAVRSVGLPAWVVVPTDATWILDELLPLEPAAVFLSAEGSEHVGAALQRFAPVAVPAGIWLPHPSAGEALLDAAAGWLQAGAWAISLADDATPERLAMVAAAIDTFAEAQRLSREKATGEWRRWVAVAAEMAPHGAGLWLDGGGDDDPPPDGWAWDRVAADEAHRLPPGRYRLAVAAPDLAIDLDALGDSLEPGGVLVATTREQLRSMERLRIVDQRDVDGRRWLICRREER